MATKKKAAPKPKYKVGDAVLVKFYICGLTEWDGEEFLEPTYAGGFEISGEDSGDYEFDESYILGLAPIEEPTKVGTVVVVNDNPLILGTGGLWSDAGGFLTGWENLLKEGTPKIVWEPNE